MSMSGRDGFPDVRERLGGPQDVREWSRWPPGCPVVVGRSFRMSHVVRRPSRMSASGREALPDVRECSDALPDVRE